ncbi:DNA-binding MarR family transcriptional regulator [Brevibacterium sanguinis]|uniref:DNA-binding MarR family transcriptional regulator n=2 Tax=Brevibacterium TaxID=1696 RepID=A0A366IGB3_9MICO|nr:MULTISPECIES: MarR family transcriptional regulator [Brevibacterium]RBP62006.1 DNA-binding MarR family transcriptional regulator [Brevibacterium sanguinis]RBP70572.1 DNA-binding MarR family transcriptional regulator [Brevibacterium celere]
MTDEPSLGVLAFLPYRHMEQRVFDAAVAAGYDITLAQGRLFQRVNDNGSRLTELAESAQLTKQSAAYLVDELVSSGFLTRSPDPSDGRARLITITDRGREAIAFARRIEADVEAEWRAHLGDADLETLRSILLRLREIVDPYAPGPDRAAGAG